MADLVVEMFQSSCSHSGKESWFVDSSKVLINSFYELNKCTLILKSLDVLLCVGINVLVTLNQLIVESFNEPQQVCVGRLREGINVISARGD